MKKLMISVAVAASLAAVTSALAWPGIQGRDWDSQTHRITSGKTLIVTGSVTTVDAIDGNRSRVDLWVNGRQVQTRTADAASTSVDYTISGDGTYRIEAVCYNYHATADTCRITVREDEVINH